MTHKYCFTCGFPVVSELAEGEKPPPNAAIHWRACVRKRDWPAWMLAPKPAYAVSDALADVLTPLQPEWKNEDYPHPWPGPEALVAPPVTVEHHSFEVCECAQFSAETSKGRAWAAHRRGKAHQAWEAAREAAHVG